jgi:RHS repeat-associated protein
VTAVTDTNGAVEERYSYTPYGEVTVLDPNFGVDSDGVSDMQNEILYTGRRLDPETGLQLNRNRFYAAHLGRWVNRDPIGYEGGSWNLYEYGPSNPLLFVDPYGLQPGKPGHPGRADPEWQDCMKKAARDAANCIRSVPEDFIKCVSHCWVCAIAPQSPWCGYCILTCAGFSAYDLYCCKADLDKARAQCDKDFDERERKKERERNKQPPVGA